MSKSTAARMEEEDELGFEDAARDLLDLDPASTERSGKDRGKKRRLEEEAVEKQHLNFYRFQRKARKQDKVVDLRSKFEEDKLKLAALKSSSLFKKQ